MSTNASASKASAPPCDGYFGGTHYIPADLANNILVHLPVKQLLRCRCVAKPWCSLIDSTEFVKKHLQKNIECNPGSGIILRSTSDGNGGFYLADVDSSCDITAVRMTDPLKTILSDTLLVSSCNGLVCLWKKNNHGLKNDIYLWNPSTRKATQLPKPPDNVPFPKKLVGSNFVGFGYDHLNDDYKVVTGVDTQFCGISIKVAVYSLKAKSWARAGTISEEYDIGGHLGCYANGSVYWVASKGSDVSVFAFDLGVGKHRDFSFPAGVYLGVGKQLGLTVLKECLCLTDLYFESHVDIWLKDNTEVENSWSKLFSVKQPGIFGDFIAVWPIAFSKSQNDILLQVDLDKLKWYDWVRNEVKNVTVHGFPDKLNMLAYSESLVQPGCNFKLNGKQQKKDKPSGFLSHGFNLKL